MNINIRKETPKDYREVEELTREAFWNLLVAGCDEHYLTHIMRTHKDFLKGYALVAVETDSDKIVGNIMYTKSTVVNEEGGTIHTVSFGPISVLPAYQRKGIGSQLIQSTITMVKSDNIPAIIIEGDPRNYCRHGFKSSSDFNISDTAGRFPFGLLVLELEKGVFAANKWRYFRSSVNEVDKKAAEEFDHTFPVKEKYYKPSQEEFAIACKAYILAT